MAQGIILAAGYSSRANTNKMLLELERKTLIMHAIDGMMPFVSHIFVVTGHYHNALYAVLKDSEKVTCLENNRYDKGMFSSIQIGVEAISDDFFVLPGDCPFVEPSTYKALLKGKMDMRVPIYNERKGHPLFIKKKLKGSLLKEDIASNLKVFRNKNELEIINVDDPNILIDIDTIKRFVEVQKSRRKEKKNGN